MTALPTPETAERVSLEEYLRREETSEVKHEFHAGVIYPSGDAVGEILAMSGGTYNHARVATNLNATLHQSLRGSPCQVLDSNMRAATRPTGRFVYPDASIICGPPRFYPTDRNQTTIINPRVVFEVLSGSTEGYDRGEKFNQYRRIESFEEYILVAQDRPLVESFLRQSDGTWSMAAWEGADATAQVRCLNLDLPLAELYDGLSFEGQPPRSSEQAPDPTPESTP